jgi:hypothetical protein
MSLGTNGLRFYGGPAFEANDRFSRRAAPPLHTIVIGSFI